MGLLRHFSFLSSVAFNFIFNSVHITEERNCIMKLFKKTLIVLGTLVTLIMLFTLFAVNTSALSPHYDDTTDNIYYFNDYYPTIEENVLEESFPTYNIVYDHMWITDSQTLLDYASYFCELNSNDILIFDLKAVLHDASALSTFFSTIKAQTACTIIVASAFDLGEFSNTHFMQYVDLFYYVQFDRLDSFIGNITEIIFPETADPNLPEGISFFNTTILIDGHLIDCSSLYSEYDFNRAISNSAFMTSMLQNIANLLPYNLGNDPTQANYALFLAHLKNNYNINFFVHIGVNRFLNLLSLEIIEANTIDDLSNGEGSCTWANLFAVGFMPLDSDFYDFLYQGQNSVDGIFLMRCTTSEYGEDGLPCTTDEGLSEMSPLELSFLQALIETI